MKVLVPPQCNNKVKAKLVTLKMNVEFKYLWAET